MTFRERYAFITPDGRRWCSFLCAARSLLLSGPRGGSIIEETRIGAATWHQDRFSYSMAEHAVTQAEKDEAAEQARNPLGLHGGGE